MRFFLFDGLAGELQRAAGDVVTTALATVIGADYDHYHEQLGAAWEPISARPEPADFAGDFARYMAAVANRERVLQTEVQLRSSWLRLRNKADDTDAVHGLPLVDAKQRLVNFLAPPPSSELFPPASAYAALSAPHPTAPFAAPRPQPFIGVPETKVNLPGSFRP